ncbi:MAG TPA: hypothetical protein VFU23_13510 [Gemmatimonadales bacterium]|nr:hypothetical protein [Gemmatimonadales bacterium]
MATRALGPGALLLALLAGCGGGGNAAAPAPDPTKGVEEDAAAKPAAPAAGGHAAARPMKVDESLVGEAGAPVDRESYAFTGGSRDPFASVLDAGSAGPELADLDLVGILYQDRNPSASVAVLRDRVTGKRYSVHEGERLGRMRVSDIRQKDVTFTIDDYGTERQQTLSLRKQEGNAP